MANYHLSIKIFSRGKGASAVAKAAYRAAECITSEYDGQTHDYTRKGGIVHKEILLPDNAPAEYADRAVLWNAVEKAETPKNAQLAREIEISLPVELTRSQNIALAREYVNRCFVEQGMCADICVHDKNDGNPHAHIMLTMRPIVPDGSWGAKSKKEYILDENGERIRLKSGEFKTRKICTTDWNEPTKAEVWRAAWADAVNAALEHNGIAERIDHRSFERQGIPQVPTVHMGVAASQMERRGIVTERGNLNRKIEVTNSQLRQLRARINKLEDWLKAEAENAEPNLQDVISEILSGSNNKTYWQRNNDLKTASKILIFLQTNNVYDLAGLREKFGDMYSQQGNMGSRLNAMERRLKALNEHIKQAETYLEFKSFYKKYKEIKPKYQEDYYENFRREIILFEAAERYLKGVMNGKPGLPVKAWKAERAKLSSDKKALSLEYHTLKEEVREVEIIRRNVEDIMREKERGWQPQKSHGMEL